MKIVLKKKVKVIRDVASSYIHNNLFRRIEPLHRHWSCVRHQVCTRPIYLSPIGKSDIFIYSVYVQKRQLSWPINGPIGPTCASICSHIIPAAKRRKNATPKRDFFYTFTSIVCGVRQHQLKIVCFFSPEKRV